MLRQIKTMSDTVAIMAPDFVAKTFDGDSVQLSKLRQLQHVVLVFNRGFA